MSPLVFQWKERTPFPADNSRGRPSHNRENDPLGFPIEEVGQKRGPQKRERERLTRDEKERKQNLFCEPVCLSNQPWNHSSLLLAPLNPSLYLLITRSAHPRQHSVLLTHSLTHSINQSINHHINLGCKYSLIRSPVCVSFILSSLSVVLSCCSCCCLLA